MNNQVNDADFEQQIVGKDTDGSSGYTLLKEGAAMATIMDVEKTYSQSGNLMVALKMELSQDGNLGMCYDQIVLIPSCEWKARQFFKALGLLKTGETFRYRWDLKDYSVPVMLAIEDYDKDGEKKKKNVIKAYRTLKGDQPMQSPTRAEKTPHAAPETHGTHDIPEDDIPF